LVSLPTTNSDHSNVGQSPHLASFIRTTVAVPDSVLEAVGRPHVVTSLKAIHGESTLNDGGKPAFVYVGSGACPSCAFQQWALLVALSRFGSFSNLGQFVFPPMSTGTPLPLSWSFTGSTYTSASLTFDPADVSPFATSTPQGVLLHSASLSRLQKQAIDGLEGPTPESQSLPFTDIANRFWDEGFPVTPSNTWFTLLEGLSLDQVAADLNDPASPVAQLIDGVANEMIGDICDVVGVKSAPMCSFDTAT
jgi:hypothetical protein